MSDPARLGRRLGRVIVGTAAIIALWLCLSEPLIVPNNLPAGMTPEAPQRCVAVFVLCLSLWLTSYIPLAATGLLALALLPALGVLPEKRAFELFGNTAVFFMLGVFLLAAATIDTGLSKRITLRALQRFDRSPGRLVMGTTISAAFLSLWMPEHAVAAMIYPILVEVVDALNLKRGNAYAKKLFLGLAWGASIGGVGTFLGGARAPLALSLFEASHPGKSIGFMAWMLAAAPVVVIMTIVALVTLKTRVKSDITDIKAATRMLDERVRRLGPMSERERRLAVLCALTIAAWIGVGEHVGLAVIAMLAASALFVLRIVNWKGVQGYVNWGVLVMYGGAVALGQALTDTQAVAWFADSVVHPEGTQPWMVIMGMSIAAILLTEAISNSAAVAVLLPIGYTLGEAVGAGPAMVTLAVTIPAGLAFLLPVSSPPNAISFSAGHYGIREVVMLGWPMTAAALVTILLVMLVWWGPVLRVGLW